MYEFGKGTIQDYTQAVHWYKKAAEQGLAEAQTSLGWFYENGKGTDKDYTQAISWYKKAAEQGDTKAKLNLAIIYKNGKSGCRRLLTSIFTGTKKWLIRVTPTHS